jgi:ABC-type nitrate/sulfonate/bicarbonate transport system substrate-binding protein
LNYVPMMDNKPKITLAAVVGVLVILVAAYLWQTGARSRKPTGPPEKVTISTLPIYTPALLFVAQEKGYFRDNGLDVTIKLFQTGPLGLEEMKAGRVDIAHVGDFVLVDEILKGGKSLRCLGSIVAAEINHLLASKDHGIYQPVDLKGKRLGIAQGTIAEFFLGRFLISNNLSLSDVKVINLSPSEMPGALAHDRVDAVMVWDPVTYEVKKRLGEKIITWPGQSGQKFYNPLVTTDEFLQTRAMVVERLLQALAEAETFLKSHRKESMDIVAQQIGLDKSLFWKDWDNSDYELSFDQALLISMENEARWMIRNRLTDREQIPNFLDYFSAGALARVNPKAMRIVIPEARGAGGGR